MANKVNQPDFVFNKLAKVNVSKMTEKKGQFTYLSWTHAWKAVKDKLSFCYFC